MPAAGEGSARDDLLTLLAGIGAPEANAARITLQEARSSDRINIREFGAHAVTDVGCDRSGVEWVGANSPFACTSFDSTAAIQEALDEAEQVRGRVVVPPGTFYAAELELPNKVAIEGAQRMGAHLVAPPGRTLRYMIRPKQIDGGAGYFHIRRLLFDGNVASGTRFTEAVISFQAAYAGSSIENVTVYDYTGAPGIWFGPGSGGDGLAEVRGEHIWVQKGPGSAPAVGILISSDHKVSLGGSGYEGLVSNVILYDIAVENTGTEPPILVHSRSENHVRALDFRSIWVAGYSGSGVVLDGVTDSIFSMLYSDQSGSPSEAVVRIATPSTAKRAPIAGLHFHNIVSRNSATPALVDELNAFAPADTNVVSYRTDGLEAVGSWTPGAIPHVDAGRWLATSGNFRFDPSIERLEVTGDTAASGGQVYLRDSRPAASGRGAAVWLGGGYHGAETTVFGEVAGVKSNDVNGDDAGEVRIRSFGSTGSRMLRVDRTGATLDGGRFGAPLSTPTSSGSECAPGQIWADESYVYVCTAPNTVKRAALSSW